MNTSFWTVFKADLLFSLCSITVMMIVTLVIAQYRKKKFKKEMEKIEKIEGPRAIFVGGKDVSPAHCPLCGRDWPLPGPILNKDEKTAC